MALFAPYDGTPLSTSALSRASELAAEADQPLMAATVVPRERRTAVDHGWLTEDERFDLDRIRRRLRARVESVTPAADYTIRAVDGRLTSGAVARILRDIARDVDATVVVMGSENVGRAVTPANTVSGRVAARLETDLYVVQTADSEFDPVAGD